MVIVSGRSALKSVPRNDLRSVAKTAAKSVDVPANGRRRRSKISVEYSPDVRIAATNGARRDVSARRQYRRLSSRVALRLSSSKFSHSNNRNVLISDARRPQVVMMVDADAVPSRPVPISRINHASAATLAPTAVVPIVIASGSSRSVSAGLCVTDAQATGLRVSAAAMDRERAAGSGRRASAPSVWMT